jgi:CHAT domain-containing protein
LVVSQSAARIVPLAARRIVEEKVATAVESIRNRKPVARTAADLHAALLGPVSELRSHRKLIVLRDGALHSLPFDALRDPNRRLLVHSHVVSYAPSAGALAILRGRSTPATERRVLALGGVPYDPTISRIAQTRGVSINGYGNLPGSRDEAMLATRTLGSLSNKTLVGKDAHEGAFKQAAAEPAAVVHIAAHAIADQAAPDKAAVLLAPDLASGEDGILQATEISQLRTSAQLVVLSACDTGVGRIQGQEGVANLSRAFLLSGARAVVSSLWSADDTFTLSLMRGLYRNLASGQPPAVALANAKRSILRTFGGNIDPYFWAGFILEGDGSQPLAKAGK